MNKSGLIEAFSKEANLTRKKTEEIINIVFNTMSQSLINGERVEIRGFGSFVVRNYPFYIARNPKTGEEIRVPPQEITVL